MRGRRIWLLIAVLSFAVAGGCAFFVLHQEQEKEDTEAMYLQMRQEAWHPEETEKESALSDEEAQGEEESETAAVPEKMGNAVVRYADIEIPVDFGKLAETNKDIYAWITVPGTEIDYPVVQRKGDDTWYLTRAADGSDSIDGSIFSEELNAKDFSDVHTVLYGHNMRDGSMFAGLHRFEEDGFFQDHRDVTIYTPDAIRYYRIFAAYLYDDRHLLESVDCSKPGVLEAYIENIMTQRNLYAQLDDGLEIVEGDRILTLSTCHSMGDHYRYLVQAVLREEIFKKQD